jgi:hypothetical protein
VGHAAHERNAHKTSVEKTYGSNVGDPGTDEWIMLQDWKGALFGVHWQSKGDFQTTSQRLLLH